MSETLQDFEENKILGNTNIIYITSDCNIDCDYCYQREDRKNNPVIKASNKQIDDFLMNLVEVEPELVSTVVIFGGEPFMEPDKVFYVYEKAEKITKEYGKQYSFCTNTNGVWFRKKENRERFWKAQEESTNNVTLEISYDGEGDYRRLYKNGKTTKDDIKDVLYAFKNADKHFHLRYTLHKTTLPTFKKDMILLSNFMSYNLKNRIVISTFDNELEPLIGMLTEDYMDSLKPIMSAIFAKYSVPLCELVCGDCRKCTFNPDKFNVYTIPDINDDDSTKYDSQTAGDFDHFSKSTHKKGN